MYKYILSTHYCHDQKKKKKHSIFVTLIKHLGQRNESKEIKIREQGLDK